MSEKSKILKNTINMITKYSRLSHVVVTCDADRDPGGVLPYMGYIGMCRCEGYGFQAVYSSIGYINQSV